MRVRHPYALDDDAPPLDGSVHYAPRRSADVDPETGEFDLPNDKRGWLDRWADRYGYDASDLLVDGADSAVSDSSAETTDGSDASEDGTCGYYDAETMASPCGRPSGWGRDADTGPCRDHAEE